MLSPKNQGTGFFFTYFFFALAFFFAAIFYASFSWDLIISPARRI